MMNKNILIIHYNTPILTKRLVESINKHVSGAKIFIFDNSNKNKFEYKIDNVTVLDNTRGQIINFDEWLKKYPKRNISNGRTNNWGSAKHSYSVDTAIRMIKEPVVLLDSDVLVKKDLSELYNDEFSYIGEVVTQPNSRIKRVLPFICFINTPLLLKNGIGYFNDSMMHGLHCTNKRIDADSYDTGASFYFECKKLKHKDIKYQDYVVHYGSGSWSQIRKKRLGSKNISEEEWLNLNKRYWSMEKNKKVIYTCITGGYDKLLTHSYINPNFDYVCFTDDSSLTSDVWEIRPLPKETEELDNVRKQRYVKVNPHKLLQEYDLSVWVDGNVDIKSDLDTLLSEIQQEDTSVYIPRHPVRRCIYDEAVACKRMRKDNSDIIDKQMEAYKKEGMPLKFGLPQSGIIIRKHNDEKCKKLMEAWWQEIKNHSKRDQLSFTYALWKNKDVNVCYLDKNIFKSKYFYWSGVHKHYTANPSSKAETKDPRMSNLKANIESIKKNVSRLKELSPERQRGRAIRFHPW